MNAKEILSSIHEYNGVFWNDETMLTVICDFLDQTLTQDQMRTFNTYVLGRADADVKNSAEDGELYPSSEDLQGSDPDEQPEVPPTPDVSNLPPLDPMEKEMVACGRTIMAVKSYRERTGANLLEAKTKVMEYRDGDEP